jgi:acyl-coenzyme A thioesterase PaaI-like protein
MNDTAAMRLGAPDAGWTEFRRDHGFTGLIGPLWFKREGDDIVFGLRAEPKHCNLRGVVHGGMMMTLLDHVMGAHVWRVGGKAASATATLNTDFTAAARSGDWIEARSHITRQGTGLVFVTGGLSVDGKSIARASGIWKILGQS